MCRMEWLPTDQSSGRVNPDVSCEACSSTGGCPGGESALASKQPLRSVLLACRRPGSHEDDASLSGAVEVRHLPPGVLVQLVPQDENHFHLETADTQSVLSLYVQKDFRYFLQHPYARLFVSYFVVFCNFLVFAEDPISHSRAESEIPVFGNVFSFVCTKYPPEWGWRCAKVLLWLLALFCGLVCGKYFIHHFLLRNLFRLKMFREEQGTWMIMLLTVLVFVYMLSLVYNALLLSGHPRPDQFRINALMGVTNASFMKVAACGTWLGDFLTAWMVTDMMLQDELYPSWAPALRAFWQSHGRTRIVVFWSVSLLLSAVVISLIVSDHISWDYLNREFVATTELSRAFLASFILVMDLLIVMQDWDFPHFVCDLNIKLPGLHAASFKYHMFQKYVHLPEIVFHISGKWFNYGIIVVVMLLDLNMWKNQIFYQPEDYGQYTGFDNKVRTVVNYATLATGNRTLWTLEYRLNQLNPATNRSLAEEDILMNSRYLGYPLSVKGLAFLPSLLGFAMFGVLTYLYGRFPPKTHATAGGRLRPSFRSSWKQGSRPPVATASIGGQPARLVVCWDARCGQTSASKAPC
ncbi:transmembrane protein 117 isoform X1 [Rhipicephalus sanguineus]|uniref:transmembrane protein 117 isoform X1 n=1 Tax=Rhipicephalus sanguineus TaxID=34632 RepID=UPI001894513A|nr:transmembrane protein 117 isoform X1 [Rhipicephalus sanguineus]